MGFFSFTLISQVVLSSVFLSQSDSEEDEPTKKKNTLQVNTQDIKLNNFHRKEAFDCDRTWASTSVNQPL